MEFLPREVAAYRARFPYVHFDVRVQDHIRAMDSLANYDVDLVLVFRPPYLAEFPAADVVRAAPRRSDAGRAIRSQPRRSSGYAIACLIPLLWQNRASAAVSFWMKRLGRGNFRFDIVAQSNSFEFLRHLVMRGQCDVVSDPDRRHVRRRPRDRDPRDR